MSRLEGVYGLRLLAKSSVQRAVLVVLAVVVLAWRAIQFIGWTGSIDWGYDLSFYWTAATALLHGGSIYSATQLAGPYVPQGQDGFLYPPPVAALFTPFAAAFPAADGYRTAEWLWAAIGAVILVAAVLAAARAECLGDRFALLRGRGIWWLVVAAFAFPPAVDELVVGNVHVLLLGLLTLAWLGVRRAGRAGGDALTGIATGAATLVKVFPGFLLAWFLVTRRWRPIAWALGAIVVLAILALQITGLEPWRQYPTVLANLSSTPQAVDALAPTMWLTPAIGFTLARVLVTLAGLAIVWLTRSAEPRLGFAIAVVVGVLVTPAMYTSYLTLFVLPLLLALSAGVPLRWLGLAYLLMWGGQQPALGDLSWVVNRAFPTAGALVLLAALVAASLGAIGNRELRAVSPMASA